MRADASQRSTRSERISVPVSISAAWDSTWRRRCPHQASPCGSSCGSGTGSKLLSILPTRSRAVLVIALIAGPLLGTARAQSPVQLDIIVPAGSFSAMQSPSIVGKNLLTDPTTRELLRNGFPTRIHYKVELWREKGLFND